MLLVHLKGSVVVMLNPSTYPDNLVESVSKVACLFDQKLVKKIILVSSTGIFSDGYEKRIDNSYYQPIPVNKRAKKIHAIETEWCKQFKNVVVVRLGGLYCSERVVGLNSCSFRQYVRWKWRRILEFDSFD